VPFCRAVRDVSGYENCGDLKLTLEGQGTSEDSDVVGFLGEQCQNNLIFRSTSKSRPNNIRGKKCLPVRPSVRPSVHKKFLQFE